MNYYSSADASAPVLTGAAGTLINLLDKVLVTGYGAKAAAGWTKDYTGTNLAAFRMGAGRTRMYLRVRDIDGDDGHVRGFETMSDVNTGTNAFPTVAQSALADNSLVWRKSATADGTVRNWVAIADSRTICLIILTGDGAGLYFGYYFGEFYSFIPADPYQVCLIGKTVINGNAAGDEHFGSLVQNPLVTNTVGHYVARGWDGIALSVPFGKFNPIQCLNTPAAVLGMNGTLRYPNASDGGIYMAPVHIATTELSTNNVRGYLRGVYSGAHAASNFTDGDTFGGVGAYAGKTFAAHKEVLAAGITTALKGVVFLETSTTPFS